MYQNYSENSSIPGAYYIADEIRKNNNLASVSDDAVLDICENTVFEKALRSQLSLAEIKRQTVNVYSCIRCELEMLQPLFDDPDVSEIMVNGYRNIFIEKNGRIEKEAFGLDSKEQLVGIIQRLAAKVGREMNDLNPIVDARLSDGSRINAVNSNIALDGPVLTIRKFTAQRMQMNDLIERNDISREAADFLISLVRAEYNIFISGGTSSGKTTFLNILSDYIPKDDRVVVIEDSAELQIRGHDNVVRLEARAANASGKGEVSITDLIKASLRMRPSKIIVGEVRGREVIDMLAAMSTGHDGSLSTGHANSPRGMIGRLETLFIAGSSFPIEAVRSSIANAIEIIVQLKRFSDGHRRVVEITEVCGYQNGEVVLNKLYEYDKRLGLVPTGSCIRNSDKLDGLQNL